MRRPLIRNGALCAPSVGTFVPTLEPGTPVRPGLRFGRLEQLGSWHDLLVPPGVEGLVDRVAPAFSPVDYGTPILHLRRQTGLRRAAVRAAVRSVLGSAQPVRADMDGTLHHRPSPGAPPFAPPGARVLPEDTLALAEVMKTFTRIRAPFGGVVRRWLVHDGGTIHAGMVIVEIDPDPGSE
ncbi:MAG: acetyl-CoA carboxylase biotin carboxyl carrier protein subunit [Deltaproteobacteria bacterium]|nr:acetyl-CoA carboxylase biotin carboxyl carrier protein subunit [Deltaproteobacteria bacterium]